MKLLLTFLLFLGFSSTFSQEVHALDLSFEEKINQCMFWQDENLDSLYDHACGLEIAALHARDTNALIIARHFLGDVLMRKGHLNLAEKYFKENNIFLRDYKNEQREASNQFDFGRLFLKKDSLETAYYFLNKSLQGYESLEDKEGVILVNEHLLTISLQQGDFQEALKIGCTMLDLVESYEINSEKSSVLNHIGKVYLESENIDTALFYFELALESDRRLNVSLPRAADIYTNMGIVNFYNGKFLVSKELFYKALGHRLEFGESKTIRDGFDNLVLFYEGIGDKESQINTMSEGLNLSLKENYLENAYYFSKRIRDYHLAENNIASTKVFIQLSDSLEQQWRYTQELEFDRYNANYYSLLNDSTAANSNEEYLSVYKWSNSITLIVIIAFICGSLIWVAFGRKLLSLS